jgi:hypothetical protein
MFFLSFFFCIYFFILYILCFCIVLCIVSPSVYSCLSPSNAPVYRPLPPGWNPIAINKFHISYVDLHVRTYLRLCEARACYWVIWIVGIMWEQEQKFVGVNGSETHTCDSVGTAVSALLSVNYEVFAISEAVNSVPPTRTDTYTYIYICVCVFVCVC